MTKNAIILEPILNYLKIILSKLALKTLHSHKSNVSEFQS